MSNAEIMVISKQLKSIDAIKDATVRRATKGMSDAIEMGKKSSWLFAFYANEVKKAFAPGKGVAISDSLKTQFGTIKGYCEAVGIDTASIHNSGKAFDFMRKRHLIPTKFDKDGKPVLNKDGTPKTDFDAFSLNVAQALELSKVPDEKWNDFVACCEEAKVDFTKLSSKLIRDAVSAFKSDFGIEDKKAKKTKAEATTDEPATDETETSASSSKERATVTMYADDKNILIGEIVKTMRGYGITLNDIATALNKNEKTTA